MDETLRIQRRPSDLRAQFGEELASLRDDAERDAVGLSLFFAKCLPRSCDVDGARLSRAVRALVERALTRVRRGCTTMHGGNVGVMVALADAGKQSILISVWADVEHAFDEVDLAMTRVVVRAHAGTMQVRDSRHGADHFKHYTRVDALLPLADPAR